MKHIHRYVTVRLLAAMLITVAVIVLSRLAAHAPAQNQNWLTLKNIRTDKATSFYADNRADHAWFVEMVLPTGHYADNRADHAWFVEMVLPTGDSDVMTENLKSVAATL
jgi:hemolysin-activating ACP:hemolysin acyltransferase